MEHSQPLEARTATSDLWHAITLGGRVGRRTALLTLGLCAHQPGPKDK